MYAIFDADTMKYAFTRSSAINFDEIQLSQEYTRQNKGLATAHIYKIMPRMYDYFALRYGEFANDFNPDVDENFEFSTNIRDSKETCAVVVEYLNFLGYTAWCKQFYDNTDAVYTVNVSLF